METIGWFLGFLLDSLKVTMGGIILIAVLKIVGAI
jgi:hypothetical protein